MPVIVTWHGAPASVRRTSSPGDSGKARWNTKALFLATLSVVGGEASHHRVRNAESQPPPKHTSTESGSALCQDLQVIHMHIKAGRTPHSWPGPPTSSPPLFFQLVPALAVLTWLAPFLHLGGSCINVTFPEMVAVSFSPQSQLTTLLSPSLASLPEIKFLICLQIYFLCSLSSHIRMPPRQQKLCSLLHHDSPRTKNNGAP